MDLFQSQFINVHDNKTGYSDIVYLIRVHEQLKRVSVLIQWNHVDSYLQQHFSVLETLNRTVTSDDVKIKKRYGYIEA